MEKKITICEKCGRVHYATRDDLRVEGWKFIPTIFCPDCKPAPKRSQNYLADMCFTHNVLTGEEIF